MKTNNRKASPSVLIVLIVAVVLVVSITFAAIFAQSTSFTRTFSVSNLSAESVVWFDGVGESAMANYKTATGSVIASVNANDANFIGKLRASVRYSGTGVGLIRVHMVEEWSTTRTVSGRSVRTVQPYRLDLPYNVTPLYVTGTDSGNAAKWLDNRVNDYCYYYAKPVYCNGTGDIALISGAMNTNDLDLGILPEGTQVNVLVEADVVQVNRYPQYWNMTELPWTDGVSADTWTDGVMSGEDMSIAAS